MANIQEKHRLGVHLNTDTYNELNDFIRNNELVTSKLSKGTVITIALNMLFKTAEHRDISDLMMEYLQDHTVTPAEQE
jgi:hypothetical protein